ncbi:MAG TPA: aminotransferase DegT [Lachnospiraceae bacterium]|nr:aminotransferase DegT [Lachnospiraceae bacterium]
MAFTNKVGLRPFKDKLWLSSPTMHGEELEYIKRAYDANWMSTVGENIDELEQSIAEYTGAGHGVSLCSGTAALHMAVKLAGVKPGDKVFCSDMTFGATVNPVVYEGGVPVFIDAEYETWNMDPYSLEKAFGLYPEVKVVVMAHLYGTPGKLDEIKRICDKHGAILIEDAAESLGAAYKGVVSDGFWEQTGAFGTYSVVSFNGNKIITGSSGGMLLTNDREAADKVQKWSTQSREDAPWYQHEELGYNYRMSNVVAGIVRGQFEHLEEHIKAKKKIYERYKSSFRNLPVSMNPYDAEKSTPSFWLSCILIDRDAMCRQIRDEREALYVEEHGKSCPTEILSALKQYNAEGRPIWKPMHMQPVYRMNQFVKCSNNKKDRTDMAVEFFGNEEIQCRDVSGDVFNRGLCLPSDIKMTVEEQERVIEIVRRCFG